MDRSLVFSDQGISMLEAKYKAKFVGDFPLDCLNQMDWSSCAAVFYQDGIPDAYKDVPTASKYIALFTNPVSGNVMITSAKFLENKEFYGLKSASGEIIYSRYRHDFRRFENGPPYSYCDGGFDYFRNCIEDGVQVVKLKVIDGVITEIA